MVSPSGTSHSVEESEPPGVTFTGSVPVVADPTAPPPAGDARDGTDHMSDDAAMVQRARRRYGAVGAIVAGGMLGLDKVLGRKPKEEGAQVQEAVGEPGDIDRTGIVVDVDEHRSVHTRPAPRGVHGGHRRVVKRRR